jgi:two-component system, NtrC family, response regulator HydG
MKMRVLVVDDDRDHAESVADILATRGIEADLAFSAEVGIELFKKTNFDFVFMDFRLPGMNGVEAFRECRKIRPDAKIMMMTGYTVEELVAQALKSGMLGILRKPFAAHELLNTLDEVKPRGMILVADDDPDFAESMMEILTNHGYTVALARNGEEALQKTNSNHVNCLILDLRMPMLSGLDVYLKLKQRGALPPTIFVTGFPVENEMFNRPFTEGIVMKPVDPTRLLSMVDAAVA